MDKEEVMNANKQVMKDVVIKDVVMKYLISVNL